MNHIFLCQALFPPLSAPTGSCKIFMFFPWSCLLTCVYLCCWMKGHNWGLVKMKIEFYYRSHFADFYFKVVYFVYPRMGMFWILMPTKFNSTDFRFTQYISINALHCHQLQELNLNSSHQNKFVCQVLFLAVVGINHRHYQHGCFAFVMPF